MSHVLVIGGGLIGLLTARALRHRGLDVTLLERAQVGRAASWAGGGILSPLYPWRTPDPVNALVRRSQALWPDLAERLHARTGIDPEYRDGGMVVVDKDDPTAVLAWAARHDVHIQHADMGWLQQHEPAIVPPQGQVHFLPDVGTIRNPRLLRAVHGLVVGEGVTVHEHAPVDRLQIVNEQVTGAVVAGEFVPADQVVVCAGAWSSRLLADCGQTPAIWPLRGQMLCYSATRGLLNGVVLAHGQYLIPRKDGRILAGSTVEEVGDNPATTEAARAQLSAFATRLLPALAEVPVTAHWAGLRPASPADVPTIDRHPRLSNLWLNAGHFRNGIVTAPASAELLADRLSGCAVQVPAAPFAWT